LLAAVGVIDGRWNEVETWLVMVIATGGLAWDQSPPSTQQVVPQISTSASGEARVQADRATMLLAVETRAPIAARAGADTSRRQQAVLDNLKKLGLSDAQLSTTGYSVAPENAL
jgi:uncharacterized protein YggE